MVFNGIFGRNSFCFIKSIGCYVLVILGGKPSAVIVSVEDFQATEETKYQFLKKQIELGQEDIKAGRVTDGAGRVTDGEKVFDEILKRKR